MALGFMVSRCLSGISVMMFPKARKDGTVAEFSRKAEDMIVRNVLIVYLGILAGGDDMDPACDGYSGIWNCSTCFPLLSL